MDTIETEVVVLGAGPGGYTAAFHAADQGKKVLLVEKEPRLGGVCLNRGCIPSKALLHATEPLAAREENENRGIRFAEPEIDLGRLREWKDGVLTKLGQGIAHLAKQRKVEVLTGRGIFEDAKTLRVETENGQQFVRFQHAIIATGSRATLPKAFDLGNPRIMTSRAALEVGDIPASLLVVGGGYIGLELGTVYARLGSRITLVEALDSLLAGADPDLARPVAQAAKKAFAEIRLQAKVTGMATDGKKIRVTMEHDGKTLEEKFDRVLVAVGRRPNNNDIGLENAGIQLTDQGFIQVDQNQQTSVEGIYAIGDIAGGIMLAHKASREARHAVQAILGEPVTEPGFVVPAVVFTDPEVAWCGLTEAEAKEQDRKVEIVKFPWAASGRALTLDRTDGLTKLLIDPETERILGVGLVGHGAGELIAEGTLAVEMRATAEDLALTVHPHPTLSETLMEAAESFYGHATHTVVKKRSS